MKCPRCGFENPQAQKFCGECGARLAQVTTPAVPEAIARKIESVKPELKGSRRDVAVIFADISGFTPMSEKLDPEEVTNRMNAVFQRLSDIIYRYEGYIDKFMGDCVMVLFGAPIGHEDDPLRAVLCAVDMMSVMKDFEGLELSIGINFGKVLAGEVGSDQKMEYTVMGDTVNLAQRLQSSAGKGETYVSESIFQQTKSEIEYQELKPIQIKGKEKLIKPYRPVSVKLRYVTRKIQEIPMVGRENELQTLNRIWTKVKSRSGQVVAIVGEAGIGKSKLVYEFQTQITRMAARIQTPIWLKGRGIDYLKTSDYWAVKEMLRKLIGFEETGTKDEISKAIEDFINSLKNKPLCQIIPFLKYLFSARLSDKETYIVEKLKREERLYILNRLLILLFKELSGDKPVIMVFDDLHWSDNGTIKFCESFAANIKSSNILLILMFRPEFLQADTPATAFIEAISRLPNYHQINLTALNEEEGIRLARVILRCDSLDLPLKTLLTERSDGNPFYIEELAGLLLNGNMVELDNNLAKLKAGDYEKVPSRLNELILAKVDRLDADLKQILNVASVIGLEFSTRILANVIELGARLFTGLEMIEHKDLIRRLTRAIEQMLSAEDEYAFKHIIIRDAVYESILRAERVRYHKHIGEVIEELFKDNLDNYLEILIHHFRQCGEKNKLLTYLQRLGEKEEKSGHYAKSETLFEEWVRIADKTAYETEQGIRLYIKLAGVKECLAKYDEGLEILESIEQKSPLSLPGAQAEPVPTKVGKAISPTLSLRGSKATEAILGNEILARIFLQRSSILREKGEYDNALGMAKKAETFLKTITIPESRLETKSLMELHANIQGNIGTVYYYKGDYDNALKYYDKSLNIGLKTLGDEHPLVAQSYNSIGTVYYSKGDYDNALKYFDKSLKILLKALGDEHPLVALSYNSIGVVYRSKADYDNALKYYDKSLSIFLKALGDEHPLVATSYNNIGAVYWEKGDYDDALKYYNKSLKIMLKALGDEHPFVATSYNNIGNVYADKGDYDNALKYFDKSLNIRLKTLGDEHPLVAESYAGLGEVCLKKGELEDALKLFEKALKIRIAKLGEDHPLTAQTKFKIAKALRALNQNDDALNYLKEAIKVSKKQNLKWLKHAEKLMKELQKNPQK